MNNSSNLESSILESSTNNSSNDIVLNNSSNLESSTNNSSIEIVLNNSSNLDSSTNNSSIEIILNNSSNLESSTNDKSNNSDSESESDIDSVDSLINKNSSSLDISSIKSPTSNSLIIELFESENSKESKITKESYTSTEDSDILVSSLDYIFDKENNQSEENKQLSNDNSNTNSPFTGTMANIFERPITVLKNQKKNSNIVMKSIGTNTGELVMTLKIPFDSSKIIEAETINIQEYSNYENKNNKGQTSFRDYEKEKRLELDELKRTLLKRNEIKMQKMFDFLLEKHNSDIDEDIFKSSMGISLEEDNKQFISKKKTHIINKDQEHFREKQIPELNNLPDINNISDLNNSDPFHMEYKMMENNKIPRIDKNGKLIIPELNNLNSEEKQTYQENRKKEILKQTKENNGISINNSEDSEIDNSKEKESEIDEVKVKEKEIDEEKEKEKNEDFEKRKKLRRERYLERKKPIKHIINTYFDMVYVISMEEDKNKVEPLLKKLKDNKVEYLLSNGINAKDIAYSKYINRWRYQIGDENIKLTKQLFDYDIYIEKNPDLIKGNINNKTRAWNHWKTTGEKENRKLFDESNIKNIGQVGCLLAHNKVIIDAIKKKYKNILILEDDIYFQNDFFEKIEDIMNKVPKKWDLLYLGAIQKDWTDINIKNNLYIAKDTYGAFAYGINNEVFEKIKKLCFELTDPFDKCLQKLHQYNYSYVLYPNIIITDIKNSKIHRSRDLIRYSKIFKWNIEDYDINIYDKTIDYSDTSESNK